MFTSVKENFNVVEAIGPIDSVPLRSIGLFNKVLDFYFPRAITTIIPILGAMLSVLIEKKLKKMKYDIYIKSKIKRAEFQLFFYTIHSMDLDGLEINCGA